MAGKGSRTATQRTEKKPAERRVQSRTDMKMKVNKRQEAGESNGPRESENNKTAETPASAIHGQWAVQAGCRFTPQAPNRVSAACCWLAILPSPQLFCENTWVQ